MLAKFWHYRTSLTAQLGLLSLLFFVLIIIQFVLYPVLEYSVLDDPVDYTKGRVVAEIKNLRTPVSGSTSYVHQSETLRKVAEENPSFRYYIESGNESYTFGPLPQFEKSPALAAFKDRFFSLHDELPSMRGADTCDKRLFSRITFLEGGLEGHAYLSDCPGGNYYFEIAGVENAAFDWVDAIGYSLSLRSFSTFQDYLLITVGVLLIGLFIIFSAVRSLDRIANITRTLDFDQRNAALPTVKLPVEVRPLVSSINEMLSRIDESRERQGLFLAAAAHEMRTPLTILRARVDKLPASSVKKQITSDVGRLSLLIEQLLSLTRLNSTGQIAFESVDLTVLVRDACATRAPVAIDRHLDLELIAPPDPVWVDGDAQLIVTAVSNLIDNAISVSAPGDRIVAIVESGSVFVRDFGPGVPESSKNTIFEPFDKTPPNHSGYGLGLAIVRTIMQLHNGSVSVSNSDDGAGGACFSLRFVEASRDFAGPAEDMPAPNHDRRSALSTAEPGTVR